MLAKKIINYSTEDYDCDTVLNKYRFTKLVISHYYKTKPGRKGINDNLIRELVKQINGQELTRSKSGYFSFEPLYIGYRTYNLVLDFDDQPFSNPHKNSNK